MADSYERKPEPIEPEDDGLYELAEDPEAVVEDTPAKPSRSTPNPRAASSAGGNDRLDPMLDDLDPPASDGGMKTGAGGKGAASHFSGDDPEYVNPEIARVRREEARIQAAQEQAKADARKKKVLLGVVGGVLILAIVAYFLLFG
ncbi:MAG: hypothetical protein AAF328_05995 [Planctomycetota bacterium]